MKSIVVTPIIDLRGKGAKEPTFPDGGCQHSISCLTCPLDYCKHDVSYDLQQRYARDIRVLDAFYSGFNTEELSEKFDLNLRTVQRIVTSNPEDLLRSRLTCK